LRKSSLTLLVLLSVNLLLSLPINNALADTSPGDRNRGGIDLLTGQLNLTSIQVSNIRPIMNKVPGRIKALIEDSQLTPQQKTAKFAEVRAWQVASINSYLTPEQVIRWKKIRSMKSKFHPHGPPGIWARPPQRIPHGRSAAAG
jgi:hypothetical protein